jgi:S1-C subfamily serine protease
MQEDRSGSEQQPPEYPVPGDEEAAGAGAAGGAPGGDDDQPAAAYEGTPPPPGSAGEAGGYSAPGYSPPGYSALGSGYGDSGAGQGAGGEYGTAGGYGTGGGYGAAGGSGQGTAGESGTGGSGPGAGGGYGAAGGSGYGASGGGYGYPGAGYQGGGQQGGAGYPGGGYPGGGYPGGGYPGGGYPGGGYGYGGYPPGDPGYGMPGGYGTPPGGYGQRPKRPNRVITYVLVAALAAGVGAGTVLAMRHNSNNNTPSFSLPSGNAGGQQGGGASNGGGASKSTARGVAHAVSPGIVDVISTPSYQPGGTLEGTGMIISSNGLVLTNNHVVEGTSHEVAELANNTSRKFPVTVLGTDSTDDVALLKLNGASNLKTVPLGNSDTARVGQAVVALGNAEGQDGAPTVVTGTITNLDRSIEASDAGAGTTENLHDMLQTNAPIVEGDSGGALASTNGKVIGMNTAANTGTTGAPGTSMGFAIPINRAMSIVRQIEAGRTTAQIQLGYPAFLGVTVASSKTGPSTSSSPQAQLQQLKHPPGSQSQGFGGLGGNGGGTSHGCLSTDQRSVPAKAANVSSGVLVGGVLCGTPVDAAGMTAGSVITAIDGNAITSPASLTKGLSAYRPGETVSVAWVSPNGQHHTSSLKLAPGPAK